MAGSAIPEPVTAVTELAGQWLPARMAAVEERLRAAVSHPGGALAEEAGETLSAGGKRMRPLLVLLCAGQEGGDAAISAAVAIELVHMATLVHDDVLDAAPLRRGLPTVVARSGRARATATGDLLFSRAFAELTGPDAARQVAALASAAVALATGELAQRQDAYETGVDADRYMHRCGLKTAALFECGCIIGRRRPEGEQRALRHFGREIGLAFQLLDDVLDVVGPAERTGKARGTDLLDGTVTLPFIYARERDPSLVSLRLEDLDPPAAEVACDRIEATGATDRVRDEARERVERGKRGLAEARLDDADRRLFEQLADGVVDRYS